MAAPKGNDFKKKWKTSKERQEAFETVCKHISRGLSKSCLPLCDWDTVEAYMAKHPEDFPSDRLRQAIREGMMMWEEMGLHGSFGKIQGFNATSWAFNMKNRFSSDWKDKHEIDQNVNGEITITIGKDAD